MAHQGRLPVAAAIALTLAAGVATVQEHDWWPTPGRLASFGTEPHTSVPAHRRVEGLRNASGSLARGPTTRSATTLHAPAAAADVARPDGGRASTLAWPHAAPTGAGARALMGGDDGPDVDVSDQPLTATGLRLLGPPVRFPASRTPE